MRSNQERVCQGAKSGTVEEVGAILKTGGECGLNVLDSKGLCALHYACGREDGVGIVMALLNAKALPGTYAWDGYTPLHGAAIQGRGASLEALLESDPSIVELENSDGETALHLSVFHGRLDCIERLLRAGAKPAHLTDSGLTALHQASLCDNRLECLRALLRYDAQCVNRLTDNGMSALRMAMEANRVECAMLLIDHGAKLNNCGNRFTNSWAREYTRKLARCQLAVRSMKKAALRAHGRAAKDVVTIIGDIIWETRRDPLWLHE